MDVIKAIKRRRSVRGFKLKKPDWRDIIEAIHSTQFAPMAGNFFSLKFVIIDDLELIRKIAAWSEQPFIAEAQYVVAFVSNPKITSFYGGRGERYMRQQTGAAIENFLLHLTKIGLDTCWVGHFNDDKIKQALGIPQDRELEALFPIGYAKEKPEKREPKGEIYKMLYFNGWDNERMKPIEKIESRAPEGY